MNKLKQEFDYIDGFLRSALYFLAALLVGYCAVMIATGNADLVFKPKSDIGKLANNLFILIGPVTFVHFILSIFKDDDD